MKFKIIYADPPWQYRNYGYSVTKSGARAKRGCEKEYQTMDTDSICALPVSGIADDDAILFLWGTWTHLADSLRVIAAWGFKYKTCGFVWIKTYGSAETDQARLFPDENFVSFWGMGNYTRSNTEFCLIGVRGKYVSPCADRGVHQIIYSPIDVHSKKPNEARKRIVKLCGDVPRVELFCRQPTDGWSVWGNQVTNDIEL